VFKLDRKVLGPEHPSTLLAMGNLAASYQGTGRRDEALKLEEEVFTLRHSAALAATKVAVRRAFGYKFG
jgi:hypothetical protein